MSITAPNEQNHRKKPIAPTRIDSGSVASSLRPVQRDGDGHPHDHQDQTRDADPQHHRSMIDPSSKLR
jgi:hypothetical protein